MKFPSEANVSTVVKMSDLLCRSKLSTTSHVGKTSWILDVRDDVGGRRDRKGMREGYFSRGRMFPFDTETLCSLKFIDMVDISGTLMLMDVQGGKSYGCVYKLFLWF